FHHFPAVETAEIHLATGFQNALLDHPAFPAEFTAAIDAWCQTDAANERKSSQTDEQFLYSTRKKAIGPFKRQLWDLPVRDQILADQAAKVAFLFKELAVRETRAMVDRYIQPVVHHRELPAVMGEAVAAAG
ncbi:MAG: class II fructose-bisphosphate aldolase, partial [Candidatus Limnocylindrales bacterium]